jgi:hypothetical protein
MKNTRFILSLFTVLLFAASCSDEEEPAIPVVIANPVSQTISSGETTSISLSSNLTETTFSWTVVEEGVTGASAGSGASITQTLTVTSLAEGSATYTITPTANGVTGNSINVIITVETQETTYLGDVKPILTASCAPCHVSGGYYAKWDDYAQTKGKISAILDRVNREKDATGFMPKGGEKLSADKIAILQKWVDDGLLE